MAGKIAVIERDSLVTGSLVAIADQLDDPVLALLADVGDHVVERNGDVASS